MAQFDLSDEEWAVIEPLLPKQGRGPKRQDDRRVLNGTAREQLSTIAMRDGVSVVFGKISLMGSQKNAMTPLSS